MSLLRDSIDEYPVRSFNRWPATKTFDCRLSIIVLNCFENCDLRSSMYDGRPPSCVRSAPVFPGSSVDLYRDSFSAAGGGCCCSPVSTSGFGIASVHGVSAAFCGGCSACFSLSFRWSGSLGEAYVAGLLRN